MNAYEMTYERPEFEVELIDNIPLTLESTVDDGSGWGEIQ